MEDHKASQVDIGTKYVREIGKEWRFSSRGQEAANVMHIKEDNMQVCDAILWGKVSTQKEKESLYYKESEKMSALREGEGK